MLPAIVEGHLDKRLLATLWRQLGRTEQLSIRDAGGSPFWEWARRYNQAGRHQIVLGLADLEALPCAAAAIERLGEERSGGFKLRIAVRMIESWVMADREAFAEFLGVPTGVVPRDPDLVEHPKRAVVDMARRSRKRAVRECLVPTGSALVGSEYTPTLARFVQERWHVDRARLSSPSLERAALRWCQIPSE